MAQAPFIKVEATKFTEVGYVGRDVESILRDLIDIAVKQERETAMKKVESLAEDAAENRVLDVLIAPARNVAEKENKESTARQVYPQTITRRPA